MAKAWHLRSVTPGARGWLGALPIAVVAVTLLVAWRWHTVQATEAARWRTRAAQCVAMAEQIALLRQQPRQLEDRLLESHTLVKCVEQSAASAGMQLSQITSIRPEAPQRVRGQDYVETYTRLRLTNVTCEQLTTMVWHLQRSTAGLSIPQLRLWVPSADAQTWEAEVTVVALTYMPLPKDGDDARG